MDYVLLFKNCLRSFHNVECNTEMIFTAVAQRYRYSDSFKVIKYAKGIPLFTFMNSRLLNLKTAMICSIVSLHPATRSFQFVSYILSGTISVLASALGNLDEQLL